METGIGENLKGFLITGNLSVLKGQNPSYHGDGSLEGTGTLYFDNIKHFIISPNNKVKSPLSNIYHSGNCEKLTSDEILTIINSEKDNV